jgi:hypothetical protein
VFEIFTELTPAEESLADALAAERQARSSRAGSRPAHGAPANESAEALAAHLLGARGEFGVAKLANCWLNTSVFHEEKATGGYDLPGKVMVRATGHTLNPCLLVRPGDKGDGRFVGAVVTGNRVRVLGWEYGARAKRPEWRWSANGRPPCFMVPEPDLQPWLTLMAVLAIERFLDVRDLMRATEGAQ